MYQWIWKFIGYRCRYIRINNTKNMLLYIWDQRIPSYRIFINFTNNAANLQFSLHKSEKHLIYTQSYRFPDPDKYRLL